MTTTTTAIEEGDIDALVGVSGEAVADADVQATVVDMRDADQVRVRVRTLRDLMSQSYFEMGRLLHRISKDGLYLKWRKPDGTQYDNFQQYVETEVEFKWRKAKHLMSIWWWFGETVRDHEVQEMVREIGWTKAAVLVGVMDAKNADKWLERARTLSIKELDSEARMALSRAGKSRPSRPNGKATHEAEEETEELPLETDGAARSARAPVEDQPAAEEVVEVEEEQRGVDPLTDEEAREYRTRWTVMLDNDQRHNVEHAIDCAVEIAELPPDSKGVCLDYVATGFLALHAGAGGSKKDQPINVRNDILKGVQRALGVDLVAFEAGTSHAIFGEETINRLLAEGEEETDEAQP